MSGSARLISGSARLGSARLVGNTDNFGTLVHQYWNNVVPQVDKQTNVFTQGEYSNIVHAVATDARVANEGEVKGRI